MNGVRVVGARSFLVLVLLFTAVLAAFAYSLIQNHRQTAAVQRLAEQNRIIVLQGKQAHDALCVFRADLDRRAVDGENFIADLVAGRRDPIPGITIADLQRSVAGQRSTLEALSNLDCGGTR